MSSSSFFFQKPEFIFRNGDADIVFFEGQGGISVYFTKVGQHLISGARSPFGSFVVPDVIDKSSLKKLIEDILFEAKSQAIELIEIKCFPEIYAPQDARIVNDILGEVGFNLKYRDVTQVLSTDLEMNLNTDRKRKIKECIDLNLGFRELSAESLPSAYQLFLQSRQSKGYPVTMKLEDFFEAFSKFPLHYKLYGVLDGDQLVAASVVIIVNDEILYYFFSGDDFAYRRHSPTSYLVYNLYHMAKKASFKFIDLGISTDKGVLNAGLNYFKRSFGSFDSFKPTFEKRL